MSVRTVCWVNEDCIAGYHMDEIECRFPSWSEEESRTAVLYAMKVLRDSNPSGAALAAIEQIEREWKL